MGIRVFGHWLFGKPDYVKRMEEIEEISFEVKEINRMIDQEATRFIREIDQISSDSQAQIYEKLVAFDEDIDQIDMNGSSLIKEAEATLVLANIDSELMMSAQDGLQRLREAKIEHDAVIARLIERRNSCWVRLNELSDECRIRLDELAGL